jgi:hypothetical protein
VEELPQGAGIRGASQEARAVKLKGQHWKTLRKLNAQQKELGYIPHYHRVGRVLMEVRFLISGTNRKWWTVVNTVTGKVHEFFHNGAPRRNARGRLVGPIVFKRKIKK